MLIACLWTSPFRLVLAGLIPSAGSMLFPFLESSDDDDTHEVEAICLTALRNMVLIDCDALATTY
jgi:hypothetical protein